VREGYQTCLGVRQAMKKMIKKLTGNTLRDTNINNYYKIVPFLGRKHREWIKGVFNPFLFSGNESSLAWLSIIYTGGVKVY
jgi:hypothetical protein